MGAYAGKLSPVIGLTTLSFYGTSRDDLYPISVSIGHVTRAMPHIRPKALLLFQLRHE